MHMPSPPLGLYAFVDEDHDLARWAYVQACPTVDYVSDLLIQRCRDPQMLASELAQAILCDNGGDKDRFVWTAACQSYGMALLKLGVEPFAIFLVQSGRLTSSHAIPAASAHAAYCEFKHA